MYESLAQEAQNMQDEMVLWRRTLHQIPEVDIHLPQTVQFITEQLDEMGITYTVLEDCSCIVASIGVGNKCIMLRGDTDGLPVVEESGLDFASTNGCMHGCGHDMHATMLLGAAKLLKAHEADLPGVVKLLFQSGEETFHGARAALAGGVLENPHVDAAFAMHVFAGLSPNVLTYGPRPMASVYGFKITLTGRGGHGSQPEICIDPINAGVEVYHALQSLIARECPPSAEAALTIGQFSAGDAANVIPEKCVLQGTLRTFDKEVSTLLIRRINEIVPAVATAFRTTCVVEELSNVPGVINDETLSREYLDSIEGLNLGYTIVPGMHVMGSEDFAIFSDIIPASYFFFGAGVEDQSKWTGQHNPKVLFNEDVLYKGAAIHAKIAMDWLSKHGNE
ncbi:M20 metallopeptidase family protein [Hespellia stercorisuis]|uniref:Amidohydrolase n=1 Tax=Hespellia stercorisuis DSM 15480 TaxID=1121950 RepID=A0A1M6VXN8_9FIRM|nr:M20 family metallopeptidase [Hespellia stercorisuis]SHK86194.1 amidohydrolase [Hespellia stercorisuis DSM 15480]